MACKLLMRRLKFFAIGQELQQDFRHKRGECLQVVQSDLFHNLHSSTLPRMRF